MHKVDVLTLIGEGGCRRELDAEVMVTAEWGWGKVEIRQHLYMEHG